MENKIRKVCPHKRIKLANIELSKYELEIINQLLKQELDSEETALLYGDDDVSSIAGKISVLKGIIKKICLTCRK